MLESVKVWAGALNAEVQTPDLWNSIAEQKALAAAAEASEENTAFTPEEQRTLLTKGKPELVPLWTLLFLTGIRRIEAVRLRREDAVIDTPAPFLDVHGKGDKWRVVPLVSAAQEAVETFVAQDNGERLLPYSYRQVYDRWREERTRLELPDDLNVHSFRHTFLSWLANRTGTPLTEVRRVAGHSSVATTEVYVHADEAMLRAGMTRLEGDLVSSWYQEEATEKKIQTEKEVAGAGPLSG